MVSPLDQGQVASPDVQGQLGALYQSIVAKRLAEAQAQEGQPDQRQAALQQYQAALRANPSGTFTADDAMTAGNISSMGRMPAMTALTTGIGAGRNFDLQNQQARYNNEVSASKAGYEDVLGQQKNDIQELNAMRAAGRAMKSDSPNYGPIMQSVMKDAQTVASNVIPPYELSKNPQLRGSDWKNAYIQQLETTGYATMIANGVPEEDAKKFIATVKGTSPEKLIASVGGAMAAPEQIGVGEVSVGLPAGASEQDQQRLARQLQANLQLTNSPNPEIRAAALKKIEDLKANFPAGPMANPPKTGATEANYLSPSDAAAVKEGKKSEVGAIGEAYGGEFKKLIEGRQAASNMLDTLNNVEQNLKGYETNKLTPLTADIAAWAKPMGLNIDPTLPNKEAFRAVAGQLALGLRNTGTGGGMPGSLSDSDREFLRSMAPNLSNTTEGNRLIIDYSKKVTERQLEMAQRAEEYVKEHGDFRGFRKEWDAYAKEHPLFTKKDEPAEPKQRKIVRDKNGNLVFGE